MHTRGIRDAVAAFSQAQGGANFADLRQHCAMEFVTRLVEACGDGLSELFRFVLLAEKTCLGRGCAAGSSYRLPVEATELTLQLPRRAGKVTWEDLLSAQMTVVERQRCNVCCPNQFTGRRDRRGQPIPNEGCNHRVRYSVDVQQRQRALLVRVTPFYQTGTGDQMRHRRSRCQLVGLDPDRVEWSQVRFRVVAAVCHLGETPDVGHYVAYARSGSGWRYMSDAESGQVDSLPLDNIYYLLLERSE
jgi:hypothetical protein